MRPRLKGIDLKLIQQLREAGLGWRTIAQRYYSTTGQDISWMTLKRRYEAELAVQRDNNDDLDCEEIN